jgi:zinc transport system ATP-binding protein
MAMTELPIVKVEHLTVYRGRYAAVEDVSFELTAGASAAIVGPNGSGKSTLVQAILDLLPRSAGTVQILGRPIARLGPLRQQIGYMPQNFIFDRSFPIAVHELVGLGWVNGGNESSWAHAPTRPFRWPWQPPPEKARAIAQALDRVNAYHLRQQPIGTLSGGELKRLLLAYCLVMPRKLLILDEAFAEVDVQGEADFYKLLDELRHEEGWTILQVSHDLDMVSRHCDHVICLNRSLVCSGQPQVALSSENLLTTYGPGFSRYHHHH